MIRPTRIDGFTFYVKALSSGAEYVAREDNSGIERSIRIADAQGGDYQIASDGRYVALLADGSQGKHGQDDLVLASFDLQTKDFVRFAVPDAQLYHTVSGPANPYWLWLKNGGSQPNTYPGDPGGALGPYRLLSATEAEWVTCETNSQGLTVKLILWRRGFDPATGTMGSIQQVDSVAVDPQNPQPEPEWYDD